MQNAGGATRSSRRYRFCENEKCCHGTKTEPHLFRKFGRKFCDVCVQVRIDELKEKMAEIKEQIQKLNGPLKNVG